MKFLFFLGLFVFAFAEDATTCTATGNQCANNANGKKKCYIAQG